MDASAKSDDVTGGERRSRQMRTLQEKVAMVQEALQPGSSVAAVARKHGVNANLLFGWLRLHRRGLLAEQRQGRSAPLLPVKITTPTLTPTEPAGARPDKKRGRRAVGADASAESMLELVLSDGTRVRLYGEAHRAVLERILAQLSLR
jgi:transposase-like protein